MTKLEKLKATLDADFASAFNTLHQTGTYGTTLVVAKVSLAAYQAELEKQRESS